MMSSTRLRGMTKTRAPGVVVVAVVAVVCLFNDVLH